VLTIEPFDATGEEGRKLAQRRGIKKPYRVGKAGGQLPYGQSACRPHLRQLITGWLSRSVENEGGTRESTKKSSRETEGARSPPGRTFEKQCGAEVGQDWKRGDVAGKKKDRTFLLF